MKRRISPHLLLSRMVDASNQGALQGNRASLASIAAIIGPLSLTQMPQKPSAFLVASIRTRVAVVIVVVFLLKRRTDSPKPVA